MMHLHLSPFDSAATASASVMVVGCGALGNEVIKNLALMGVGRVVLVDFDRVDFSNLPCAVLFTREDARDGRLKVDAASAAIARLNPDVEVVTVAGDIAYDVGLGIVAEMDVVIGCVDSRWARYCINRMAMRAGIPWVDGGIDSLEGTVRVFVPGENCYACALSDNAVSDLKRRMPCPGTVRRNILAGRAATTPISASIIAAVQVQEAMKIIHKSGDFTPLCGRMFYYEGAHLSGKTVTFSAFDEECPCHEVWTPVVFSGLSTDMMVGDVLDFLEHEYGAPAMMLSRDNCFVDYIFDRESDERFEVMLAGHKVEEFIASDVKIGGIPSGRFYQNEYRKFDRNFPYPELSLKKVGFPYKDIIKVIISAESQNKLLYLKFDD